MNKLYLILENGRVFEGCGFGADGEATGELIFTTAMTGYVETITDPSYYGQIIVQTFPLIGNYGVMAGDMESDGSVVSGYIVREWCEIPSNFRSEGDLDGFLKRLGVVGLCGVDTRAITRVVRERGVMNARISKKPELNPGELQKLCEYRITGSVPATSGSGLETLTPESSSRRVVLWDFGAKGSIANELLSRGCEVVIVPSSATAKEIMELEPHGLMLSNGPGDPADNVEIIEHLRTLCNNRLPIFGICLGHQLLALSQGAKSEKLKYGHRGGNQPALETATGKVHVTTQNHGYAVINDSLPKGVRSSFVNANDGTCEGCEYDYMPAFSVQFHPEAHGGPLDSKYLFDRFVRMMDEYGEVRQCH